MDTIKWPNPIPKDLILTNLNQHYLRLLSLKWQLLNFFFSLYIRMWKLDPLLHPFTLWPHPTHKDCDSDKLEFSTLYKIAFTKFTAFLADWFWKRIFFKDFSLSFSSTKGWIKWKVQKVYLHVTIKAILNSWWTPVY